MAALKWVSLVSERDPRTDHLGPVAAGDRLPSTAPLCAMYQVSTIVVRNAMISLKAGGLVREWGTGLGRRRLDGPSAAGPPLGKPITVSGTSFQIVFPPQPTATGPIIAFSTFTGRVQWTVSALDDFGNPGPASPAFAFTMAQ